MDDYVGLKSIPVQSESERVNSMAINSAVLPQGDRSGAQRVSSFTEPVSGIRTAG